MQSPDSPEPSTGNSPAVCPFCDEQRIVTAVATMGDVFAIRDSYPVTDGHLLIIPRRHTPDFFSMTSDEKASALAMIDKLQRKIRDRDSSVKGFNIGVNCGAVAGQTIMHAHIHLIPRRVEDTPNPRGGVRGVIPEKMSY